MFKVVECVLVPVPDVFLCRAHTLACELLGGAQDFIQQLQTVATGILRRASKEPLMLHRCHVHQNFLLHHRKRQPILVEGSLGGVALSR